MPTGGNRLGGGFYRNSPVAGHWADFVTRDLVGTIDGSFRTLAAPESRVVTGHSMGGYGAIHLAMEHPGTFSAAYAMSPCCLAPVEDLGFGNTSWQETATFDEVADLDRAIEERRFWAVAAQAIAAAFLPDRDAAPLFVDLPFRIERGETVLEPEEYADYLEAFPVARVDERRGNLLALRGLALDTGILDQFLHIPAGVRMFSEELSEWRIPHRMELYDGDHRGEVGRRLEEVVFPWIAARLGE
jgi:S-formylglutathione hydrolase FrmB